MMLKRIFSPALLIVIILSAFLNTLGPVGQGQAWGVLRKTITETGPDSAVFQTSKMLLSGQAEMYPGHCKGEDNKEKLTLGFAELSIYLRNQNDTNKNIDLYLVGKAYDAPEYDHTFDCTNGKSHMTGVRLRIQSSMDTPVTTDTKWAQYSGGENFFPVNPDDRYYTWEEKTVDVFKNNVGNAVFTALDTATYGTLSGLKSKAESIQIITSDAIREQIGENKGTPCMYLDYWYNDGKRPKPTNNESQYDQLKGEPTDTENFMMFWQRLSWKLPDNCNTYDLSISIKPKPTAPRVGGIKGLWTQAAVLHCQPKAVNTNSCGGSDTGGGGGASGSQKIR